MFRFLKDIRKTLKNAAFPKIREKEFLWKNYNNVPVSQRYSQFLIKYPKT